MALPQAGKLLFPARQPDGMRADDDDKQRMGIRFETALGSL